MILRNNKKAQVTMFIILGIVIFSFFSMQIYQSQNLKKKELVNVAETQVTQHFQSSQIQNYVRFCLEKTLNKGIEYMSKQGGYIYDYQGGIFSTDKLRQYGRNNITYALYYDQSKNSTYLSPMPPMYPASPLAGKFFPGYSMTNDIITNFEGRKIEKYIFYLGSVNGYFPKLCLKNSTNYKLWVENNKNDYYGCGRAVSYGEKGEYTIQEQLQEYINKNLKECTNFDNFSSNFENSKEYEYMEFIEGNISSNILFGNDDMFVIIDYPIKIKFGEFEKIVPNRYDLSLPLRFKHIWAHIYSFLSSDSKRFTYDKKDLRVLHGANWKSEFESEFVDLGYDEMYVLTDKLSIFNNRPFTFNILIQNRRPALEPIKFSSSLRPDLDCYDIVTVPGETITITPQGYDPDEDDITYEYKGWNQNYFAKFNTTCFFKLGGSLGCARNLDLFEICEKKDYSSYPGYWTDLDSPYQLDKKTGQYETVNSDIGLHSLRVEVSDGELKDWQDVKILILDIPTVILKAYNIYNNEKIASIEDPFVIDPTDSRSYMVSLSDIKIDLIDKSNNENAFSMNLDGMRVLRLPKNSPYDIRDYPIDEIKKDYRYRFEKPGDYKLELQASNGFSSGKDSMDIEVFGCLSHRNDSPSYPYNDYRYDNYPDTSNPFMADHTCCADSNTILGTGVECYSLIEYGSVLAFDINHLEEIYNLPMSLMKPIIVEGVLKNGSVDPFGIDMLELNFNSSNDIIRREFRRNCDGSRGNICNGTINDNIYLHLRCDDTNKGTGGNRRCNGPSFSKFSNVSFVQGEIVCEEYSGKTFESIMYEELTGVRDYSLNTCDDRPRCSNRDGAYGENGHYICNATCLNGECIKPTECYDCYNDNTCGDNDPTNDIYVKGTVSGEMYDGCNDLTNSCELTTYSSFDFCHSSTGELIQVDCHPDYKNTNQPYYNLPTRIDCAENGGAKDCRYNPTNKEYEQKGLGKCEQGVCVDGDYESCGAYSCISGGSNGDSCASICSNDDHCNKNKGYYCFNNECVSGGLDSGCDKDEQCNEGLRCDESINKCIDTAPPGGSCGVDSDCDTDNDYYCKEDYDGKKKCTKEEECIGQSLSEIFTDNGMKCTDNTYYKKCEGSIRVEWTKIDAVYSKCDPTDGENNNGYLDYICDGSTLLSSCIDCNGHKVSFDKKSCKDPCINDGDCIGNYFCYNSNGDCLEKQSLNVFDDCLDTKQCEDPLVLGKLICDSENKCKVDEGEFCFSDDDCASGMECIGIFPRQCSYI